MTGKSTKNCTNAYLGEKKNDFIIKSNLNYGMCNFTKPL